MGDNNQSCRGFETPTLGGDLWPMGFDVDLALDGPGSRKGPTGALGSTGLGTGGLGTSGLGTGGLGSTGLGTGGLNNLQSSSSVSGSYNDIQHLSGLSSILQRFDDLHAGDICQMTDLTNSLPKGDSETAQSLLAKLACQDLGPDLSSGTDPSHKELETSLFNQTPNSLTGASGNNTQGVVLPHKPPIEPADVYGRMTCYGGKIILQLKHVNLSTNYTLNVDECWLCGEKINSGSQLFTHKHSLNGMFQVNDEYVQLDIEHYIIPEHALETAVNGDMTGSVLHHTNTSALHPDFTCSRRLELSGNLTSGGDGLSLGEDTTLQYTEQGLVPPLSSSSNLINSAIPVNHNSCMNTFNQLPFQGMPITSSQTNINSNVPVSSICATDSMSHSAQPLCSVGNPVFGLSHTDPSCSNALMAASNPAERKSVQNNHINMTNNYSLGNGLNHFGGNTAIINGSLHNQQSHRYPTTSTSACSRTKQPFHYHTPFPGTDFSCHGTAEETTVQEKHAEVTSLTQLNTVTGTTTFDIRPQRSEVMPRKAETGAKKRKSRAQKKPSVIQMREYRSELTPDFQNKLSEVKSQDCLSTKGYNPPSMGIVQVHVKNESINNGHLARSNASIEDWIEQNLPDQNPVVLENKEKHVDIQQKPPNTETIQGNQEIGIEHSKKSARQHRDQKPCEPAQTSRLAAHMLIKGLDLTCRICSKDFGKDISKYKIHMKEHGVKEEDFFACYFCTKTFKKGKHYTQHLKTHIRTRRFSCQMCSASYSRVDKLRRHVLTHSQKPPERDHSCPTCQKSFTSKYYLQKHMKVHMGKKYKCETCGFLCSSPYNLETHKLKHVKDKPYRCELCERTFVRRDFLDNHMELVHKNKRSKCEICGKLFSRKDVLKRHLAVHNNESYDCEICGRKFSRKDRLVAHVKKHKHHCDFKCSLCPASFARKNVLIKHERAHKSKEQCKVCYKFMVSKQKLETHMAIHEKNISEEGDAVGPRKCEICNAILSSKEVLRKHLRRMHGKFPPSKVNIEVVAREKKFACHRCPKSFTRSCNLSTHLMRAHSKNLDEDEFNDDLHLMLRPSKAKKRYEEKKGESISPSSFSSSSVLPPYNDRTSSISVPNCNTSPLSALTGGLQSIEAVGPSDTLAFPTSSLTSNHPLPLPSSSSHFPSSSVPPDSPINLSTEGIAAAAYLLAYPSYAGPY